MKKISPLIKGVITGSLMMIVALVLHYANSATAEAISRNIWYLVYAGGIGWTLYDYSRSAEYTGKFGDIFLQGFRCFIIVTLIMVAYLAIFSMLHPELAEQSAAGMKAEMLKTEKNRNEAEIDALAQRAREGYTTFLIYSGMFTFLLVGAVFTLAGTGILLIRKKQ